ncbi:pyrroloquinoline quinone biosynthesis peptide chaperone PqqD [Aurantimonas sp. MSK8Z-1]|nr:pyrroloquinoline quinone biosynthesis peptide chaperone PqqD [Aurantimonas sp. MSK8Z-1]
MSALADDCVPTLPRGVRLREDHARGGTILVAPERIFTCDEIATEILKRCDGAATLAAIVADLSATFTVGSDQIRPDVEELLIDLRDKQMVTL